MDYDAVAHHVGIMQPEALSALQGIDRVLGQLERVAAVAPRPYHLVVLSDHGQSQGATFRQRHGETLDEVVKRLAAPDPVEAPSETQPELADFSHEQMRTVWTLLRDNVQRLAVATDLLGEVRKYLAVHWRRPASETPPLFRAIGKP